SRNYSLLDYPLVNNDKMRASLCLLVVGVALVTAAPSPQFLGGHQGHIQPSFLGGINPNPFVQPGFVQPGFVQPGFVQPGLGFQQQLQLNQAGRPCEKFSRNQFGNYVCTESIQQTFPGAFEVGGSQGFGFGK
ncbi:unnamed protein product, partial [Meganyctiphanes norvegica]